jgi:hypothetical protein
MPALISDLKKGGYFKIRIYFDDAFDESVPEEKEFAEIWKDHWVDVREVNAAEAALFQEDYKAFMNEGKIESLIVDHSFENEGNSGNKKGSNKDVADLIRSSATVYTHFMSEWAKHLPLARRNAGNSVKPAVE